MKSNSEPLEVLQIATGFPGWGGTELHLLNLSAELVRRGHRVTVACRSDGWVIGRAREMGLNTLEATVRRQQDWSSFSTLRSFMVDRKVDVVHTHWSTDAFVPPAAARVAGVPVRLMTRHSPYPFKTALGRRLFTDLLYNRLVAISGSVAKTLAGCGVPEQKLTVVHHGTDVEAFANVTEDREAVRKSLGLLPGDIAVGIIGRVAKEKGHRYLFDAARQLPAELSVKIVVVGDGPLTDESRAYVQEHALEDRVIFSPFRTDVNNVFNALDVITVPSVWEEPCSAVVQQAMVLGRPLIGTVAGGTPEMVVAGETGLLVPQADATALRDAIVELASDPALRERMGKAGRERVEELFSLRVMVDKIEGIYRRELSNTQRPSDLRKALAS